MKLDLDFYSRPTVDVARTLLGHVLVRRSPQGTCAGIIVETEAYTEDDPACHANRGKTKRNAMMFARPGLAYVYFIYGMHHCFNIVTAQEGIGEAVLIRALAPLAGIALMKKRRGHQQLHELCSGPARLCQALAITTEENGVDLLGSEVFLLAGQTPEKIVTTGRVGISAGQELPYRFYIADSQFVSRK
jgi:DNA-3-methyladenine glycosylase